LLLCYAFGGVWGQGQVKTQSEVIDSIFKDYDKRIRPTGQNGVLNVSVNILVLDVFNVDETKHEFSVTMYLRQHWLDQRLQYTRIPGMNQFVLDAYHATLLWTPDTFILNERNSVLHKFGILQEYTKIRPDGRILQSSRVTVTASCKMNLGYFPFDRQLCGLELASYANIGSEYSLGWSALGGSGAAVSEDLSPSSLNFRFDGIKTSTKTLVYPSGNQTRLGLGFYFARHSIRFVQDVFFPAFMLTVIAFCTLYCASLIVGIQLNVALIISIILFMGLNSNWMPRVSYQTALDLYVAFSALNVFICLLVNFIQYNFQASNAERKQGVPLRDLNAVEKSEALIDYDRSNAMNEPLCEVEKPNGLKFGSKVDNILMTGSALLKKYLPISYVCFNIIFWMVVLIGSSFYPQGFLAMEEQE